MYIFIYSHTIIFGCIVSAIAAGVLCAGIYWFGKREKEADKHSWTNLLKDVQRVSRFQYTSAFQYLQSFSRSASNDTDDFLSSLVLPECINKPASLLSDSIAALKKKSNTRAAAKLFRLRDEVKYQHDSLREYLQYYKEAMKLNEKNYYENLIELSKMHDDLGRYMSNKNFDKINGSEWYEGYFSIFSAWFRSGANRDTETTYREIVQKIIALNKAYSFVPYVIQTTACTLKCDIAYCNILALNKLLEARIIRYAYYCKLSYRMIRFVLKEPGFHLAKTEPEIRAIAAIIQQNEIMTQVKHEYSTDAPAPEESAKPGFLSYIKFAAIPVAILMILYFIYTEFYPAQYTSGISEGNRTPPVKAMAPDTAVSTLNIAVVDSTNDTTDFRILFDPDAKSRSSVYGIDVSKYQGSLVEDLKSLDTIHFLICKATEGGIDVDPDFDVNWSYIKRKGFIRGAYHFFHSEDAPVKQASLFLQTIKELRSIDIPPIVDVEEGSLKNKTDPLLFDRSLLIFLKYVKEKTRRNPVIYSNTAFVNKYLINDSLSNYPLWLAEYTNKASPEIPGLWKKKGYVIWQKSSSYSIDSRKTDFDIFNGDGHAFVNFIRNN